MQIRGPWGASQDPCEAPKAGWHKAGVRIWSVGQELSTHELEASIRGWFSLLPGTAVQTEILRGAGGSISVKSFPNVCVCVREKVFF